MGDVKKICYYVNGEFKESKSGEYRDNFHRNALPRDNSPFHFPYPAVPKKR